MGQKLMLAVICVLVGLVAWLGLAAVLRRAPVAEGGGEVGIGRDVTTAVTTSSATTASANVLRIGLIPERDLFAQRKAYQALALYFEKKNPGGPRVALVTSSTYAGILADFKEGQIDAAFAGSLIAILAADRVDAGVLLKSESARTGGQALSTYTGMIFVREEAAARRVEDLAGKRVAGVRTTMGGAVFPLYTLQQLPTGKGFEIIWGGTHEDVIREVVTGNVDAGAVKNTRLEAYEREHPGVKFRRLAESSAVPDNALIVRPDLDGKYRQMLVTTLLTMHDNPDGQAVLAALGMKRFVPCDMGEYGPLYAMIEKLGDRWSELEIGGPAPRAKGALEKNAKP